VNEKPTVYLSNWSSYRTPGMHGPGWKLTIMARPRAWENGDGTVHTLTPQGREVEVMHRAVLLRTYNPTEAVEVARVYREMIERRWSEQPRALAPGVLYHVPPPESGQRFRVDVVDGDTLCCACSVAEARAGRCHRAWAAPFLVRAGWRVILDGVEYVAPVEEG